MTEFPGLGSKPDLPRPGNPESVALGWRRWHELTTESGRNIAESFDPAFAEEPRIRALLDSLFGHSPYLTQCVLSAPRVLLDIVMGGPESVLHAVLDHITGTHTAPQDEARLSRDLRQAKKTASLAIAIADITGQWTVDQVTAALSRTAEVCLDAAAAHALREAHRRGAIQLEAPEAPLAGSGLIILGMGKLGAVELNYSSDIDLIVLYDPDRMKTETPDALQTAMVRLTRLMMRLMEERTADGYVFRTDLRLRPDPSATPIALSTYAAETYYESLGQNWERAAMIKARPVAGDLDAGEEFLGILRPFIWRKYLDFAAIQDIRAIKRQINTHRVAKGDLTPQGHNVKLGQGGIREIEFFAQTQQLIWGGRVPALRIRRTKDALNELVACGQCASETASDLIAAYDFLRTIEHRLQMVDDAQTHTLPADEHTFESFAAFAGYESGAAFTQELKEHLGHVQAHYGALFEDAPSLGLTGEVSGNLVFTGAEPDPDTLETLSKLGFTEPGRIDAQIRLWHRGRYKATRSTRSRELLTELGPALLTALAKAPEPDATFLRFDQFLAGLPAGVQLFSMFHAHPRLLELVVEIIGKAPRLARHMSHNPGIIESVLAPGFFEPLAGRPELRQELTDSLKRASDMEDVLIQSRRWANEYRFRIGVQRLRKLTAPHRAARDHADVAEIVLQAILDAVTAEFEKTFGRVSGGGLGILALGRLGSREMSAASDLDLIFVYDFPETSAHSDGEKPLAPSQYYGRLTQRVINAVTAMTPEGVLYEVDMRLRPSGKMGPIATSLAAFVKYQADDAWTWEHLALARARVVAGPEALAARISDAVNDVLRAPRDAAKLLGDVADMRTRLAREKPAACIWDTKNVRGGLVDIAFIAQYLTLRHASAHPDILASNTWRSLENLGNAGLLAKSDAETLKTAQDFWLALYGMLALTCDGEPLADWESGFSDTLIRDLAEIAACEDIGQLKSKMQNTAYAVLEVYNRLIDEPATA